MTLGELLAREDLVGRIFRAHDKSGFAFRGIIAKVETPGDSVCFLLLNYARRSEGERNGPWKNLPGNEVKFGKDMEIRKTVKDIITFTLGDGGRGYFYPKGTHLEEVENAPRLF